MNGIPPTSSTSTAKACQPGGKGESMAKAKATHPEVMGKSPRELSPSIALVDSKQSDGTKEGVARDVKKRKHENIPGTQGPPRKIPQPTERCNASVERENSLRPELQKRADKGVARGSSPNAEKNRRGEIFKPKRDSDTLSDTANLVRAIQDSRVLLLENLAPGLHSTDLAEALTEVFNHKCDVRIAPPSSSPCRAVSSGGRNPGVCLQRCINTPLTYLKRLVTTRLFTYKDFKPKSSTRIGHIDLPKSSRDYTNEDYKDALATSHLAQGNTIEFNYGVSWRVLDEQHEVQWRMLQEEFDSSKAIASKKMA